MSNLETCKAKAKIYAESYTLATKYLGDPAALTAVQIEYQSLNASDKEAFEKFITENLVDHDEARIERAFGVVGAVALPVVDTIYHGTTTPQRFVGLGVCGFFAGAQVIRPGYVASTSSYKELNQRSRVTQPYEQIGIKISLGALYTYLAKTRRLAYEQSLVFEQKEQAQPRRKTF